MAVYNKCGKLIKSSVNSSNPYGFYIDNETIYDKYGNFWTMCDYFTAPPDMIVEPFESFDEAEKNMRFHIEDSLSENEVGGDFDDYCYEFTKFAEENVPYYIIESSRKPIKSSNLIKSNVEIDDDIFIELLWDRVNSFTPAKGYDDEFWTECFDYLSEIGWMGDPWKNDPKYIVDNIAVNGEIFALEDCADNYDEINDDYKGDVNAWIEDNGYLVFGDYVVINLGL